MFRSTKTFLPGFSCCFRQWRADSHCNRLHGYALVPKLTFQGVPDDKFWVMDFGSLKPIKAFIEETFDHKTLVAHDDPARTEIQDLNGIIFDAVWVSKVGIEAFAEIIGLHTIKWLEAESYFPRVEIYSVELWEHASNSAIWINEHARSSIRIS